MNVVAVMTLHYGLEYLAESIRSVINDIDALWCIYSPTPSFGFNSGQPCPDHAEDLYETARQAAGDKFNWYTLSPGQVSSEGQHFDFVHQLAPDADVVIRLDADECWGEGLLREALHALEVAPSIRQLRVPFVHLWRSFYRGMPNDKLYPTRLHNKRATGERSDELVTDKRIVHLGYAQSSAVVEYKMRVQGHAGEWRSDWYAERWQPNSQKDVHPTMAGWWNVEGVDPWRWMPAWMKEHENAKLDVIP